MTNTYISKPYVLAGRTLHHHTSCKVLCLLQRARTGRVVSAADLLLCGQTMRVPRTPLKTNSGTPTAGRPKPLLSLGVAEKAAPALRKSPSQNSLSADTEVSAEGSPCLHKLSKAQQRCSQALRPALGALAAAHLVLVSPDGEYTQNANMLNYTPPSPAWAQRIRGRFIPQSSESGGQQSQTNGSRASESSQSSEVLRHRRPINRDPLKKVPFVGNRAPDFPPSRSRLTLAERAAAAAS